MFLPHCLLDHGGSQEGSRNLHLVLSLPSSILLAQYRGPVRSWAGPAEMCSWAGGWRDRQWPFKGQVQVLISFPESTWEPLKVCKRGVRGWVQGEYACVCVCVCVCLRQRLTERKKTVMNDDCLCRVLFGWWGRASTAESERRDSVTPFSSLTWEVSSLFLLRSYLSIGSSPSLLQSSVVHWGKYLWNGKLPWTRCILFLRSRWLRIVLSYWKTKLLCAIMGKGKRRESAIFASGNWFTAIIYKRSNAFNKIVLFCFVFEGLKYKNLIYL